VACSSKTGKLIEVRQPHLILITGLPGTGKSTLGRSLARHLGLPLICKDTIKEPLLDVIGAVDRPASRRLSDASFAVMFALARDCLRVGTDVILEGNFRSGEHEAALSASILEANASACSEGNTSAPAEAVPTAFNSSVAGADAALRNDAVDAPDAVRVTQILCRAAESVRLARLKARANDPSRHAGHRDADLAADLTSNLAADLTSRLAPNVASNLAPGLAVDHALDPAPNLTTDPMRSTSNFLALPGARFMFDSDGALTQLQALLKSLGPSWRDNPHV
jgi:predicted kinase